MHNVTYLFYSNLHTILILYILYGTVLYYYILYPYYTYCTVLYCTTYYNMLNVGWSA